MDYIYLLNNTKIINNKITIFILDKLNIFGITLGKYIFVYDKNYVSIILHELVHRKQYMENGFFKFIFLYLTDYFVNLIKYRNNEDAYYNIKFEKEAYAYKDEDFKEIYFKWIDEHGGDL